MWKRPIRANMIKPHDLAPTLFYILTKMHMRITTLEGMLQSKFEFLICRNYATLVCRK